MNSEIKEYLVISLAIMLFSSLIVPIYHVEAMQIPEQDGGLLVYSDSAHVGYPTMRGYNGTFSAEQNATYTGVVVAINLVEIEANPIKDEYMIAVENNNNDLFVQVCKGNQTEVAGVTCGSTTTISLTQSSSSSFKSWDFAYESLSGDGLMVYRGATADTMYYIVYDSDHAQWITNSSITTTRTSGTVEWVELESRLFSNQIGVAYSDSNDDVSGYRWDGDTNVLGDEHSAVLNPNAPIDNNRKFDVSFETTSGDMLIASMILSTGTVNVARLVGTTWTLSNDTSPDLTQPASLDIMSPCNEAGDDLGIVVGPTGNIGTEGFEWSGSAVVDGAIFTGNSGLSVDDGAIRPVVACASSTFNAVSTTSDGTNGNFFWLTMDSAGTWTNQTANIRSGTRAVQQQNMLLIEQPNSTGVMAFMTDTNLDLWADYWDGVTTGSSAWTDKSSTALETSMTNADWKDFDYSWRYAPINWENNMNNFWTFSIFGLTLKFDQFFNFINGSLFQLNPFKKDISDV